ncbi:substrate-binding domain-containing protein [Amphibacillus jilinensis]|uniref:substrate-binding domain-containing protein n=1 Tax=Amphibacillus jilinensis TaxID=1216008 RepID=UPI0002DA0766|nr:substrate-binding domain-containing protein [Amphibacillus jilinensis]
MRKLVLFLLFTLVFVVACDENGAGDEGNDIDQDQPTIALTVINQEALFFTEMVKGAEAMAEELGANLNVYNANNNQVDQNNAIENFISEGVDAIIINAIDPGALMPVVEQAADAGIPLISVDSVIDHESINVQIGVDNSEESVRLAEYFNEYWDGAADIGIVSALNSPIQINRQDSFVDTVEAGGSDIISVVDGENVQENALSAAENLFISNPDLDAVYVTGEPAFIGAVSAVRSQGKEHDIKLFGWDLSAQVLEGIDEGFVEAVIQQHPDQYGAESVSSAFKLINGEDVDGQIDVPATIVTAENVEEFRSMFE